MDGEGRPDPEKLSYSAAFFAAGFAVSVGIVNFMEGADYLVYMVLGFSMLVVAFSQFYRARR